MSPSRNPYVLNVGEPFKEPVPLGSEGAQIGLDEQGLHLRIACPSPTPLEALDLQRDPFEVRITGARHSVFFYFRIRGWTWIEGFFSPWRARANGFGLYRDPDPGRDMWLHAILIDSMTGLPCGMREIVFSHTFSTAVLAACHDILNRREDVAAHAAEVAAQLRVPLERAVKRATIRFSTAIND